jgi:hypothetical protein
MKDNENRDENERGNGKAKKKAYRRPEILYREALEAMAALCTPSPPAKATVGTCPTAQKS